MSNVSNRVQTSRLWLPFTQMQSFDREARTFVRGDGTTLVDASAHRLFDAVSSIWTTIHGHGHPYIVEAIARQAAQLDHATTLGASNPIAEQLAERLCALTEMDYAFFGSDGASAIEAALKMTLVYWRRAGQPQRTRFVHLVDSYHGDTIGAMSISDVTRFKAPYSSVLFESVPYSGAPVFGNDVAAIVVEPVVQAAAGMRIVAPELYDALGKLGGDGPLLIVDEIATGFGRTGTMFAHESLAIEPDIVCAGKGITGGTLALSATLVRERIYDAFLGDDDEHRQFFHGHSYAGNPIACAAALASLDLFEREQTLENVSRLADRASIRLRALAGDPRIDGVRQAGLMIGVDVPDAPGITARLYERGQFTRAIGSTVQFVPPLSSTEREIDAFFDALESEVAAP
jgi:adenosylmethionine-8-amino-7-oxononanoate aminotransferase